MYFSKISIPSILVFQLKYLPSRTSVYSLARKPNIPNPIPISSTDIGFFSIILLRIGTNADGLEQGISDRKGTVISIMSANLYLRQNAAGLEMVPNVAICSGESCSVCNEAPFDRAIVFHRIVSPKLLLIKYCCDKSLQCFCLCEHGIVFRSCRPSGL